VNQVASIEVRHLSKSFVTREGRLDVLKTIDLDLRKEEILCIVGPSGCGKSTLLKIVAGLIPPDSGFVRMRDKPVTGPSRDRAVVFQEDAVFPWLTVKQNIEYGLAARGVPPPQRRAVSDHYLNIIGLAPYANFYPKDLSGGMKKRVDLARAYANEPQVLLMDEAFGFLDVLTKEQMQLDLSRLLAQQRMTILFVTHDIEEAIFLGDRVAVMSPKPGVIRRLFEIPFGRPRDRLLKSSPEFQKLRVEIYGHMFNES